MNHFTDYNEWNEARREAWPKADHLEYSSIRDGVCVAEWDNESGTGKVKIPNS